MKNSLFIYVGTYSLRGSEGIYTLRLDTATGELVLATTTAADNPSFLALSPDRRTLYAVHEETEIDGKRGGAVSAYSVDEATGALAQIGTPQPTFGIASCHVHVDSTGSWLITANYGDGTHSVLPIRSGDGGLGSVVTRRANVGEPGPGQESAHAHSTSLDEETNIAYACDLGLDKVIVYELDPASGNLKELPEGLSLPPGSGPRHLVAHPTLPLLYVINELNSTIAVVRRADSGRRLSVEQTISTLPANYDGNNQCADIHFSPDLHTLYGSNRGHDSLAIFAVDDQTGLLTPKAHVPTGGHWPRNFAVIESGWILVANERSDNLVSFRIDASGVPIPTGFVISVPSPACVLPLI